MTLYRKDGSEILSADDIVKWQKRASNAAAIARSNDDIDLVIIAQEFSSAITEKIRKELEIE